MVSLGRLQPARILLLAVLAVIILSRIVSVADGRDPGVDQAALMANFPLAALTDLFRPLAYFEQTTSLGSAIELDLISRLFGTEGLARFYMARGIAALAACTAYFLIYLILRPRFSLVEIALILALLAAPREILLFTTNPKHYVFELVAACLLIRAGLAYLERPQMRESVIFLAHVIFAGIVAVSAPLIVVAVGSGMAAATLARQTAPGGGLPWPAFIRLSGLGLVAIAICALFYVAYTGPVSVYQAKAYAYEYEVGLISLHDPFSAENIAAIQSAFGVFYQMIEPAYAVEVLSRLGLIAQRSTLSYLAAIVAILGYLEYWRRSPFLAGGLTGGMTVFVVLNLAGALPFVSTRHFMFFAPFAVPCFVLGLVILTHAAFRMLRMPGLATPSLGAIALVASAAALRLSTDLENTEVSGHFDRIEAHPAPLWIYYGAQPSARAMRPGLLAREDPPVLGLLPHASSERPWALAARTSTEIATFSEAAMQRTRQELAGTEPVWILFANHWPERQSPEGLDPFFAAAEADGRICRRRPGINSLLAYCALREAFPDTVAEGFE